MTTATPEPAYWTLLQKIAFRFFLIIFIQYIFFNPNGVIPFSDTAAEYYIQPFHQLIPWLAAHVMHLAKPVTIFTNGSGDTTYDYLVILFITIVAALLTLVWSLAGRNTRNYNKLLYWLCVIVRYYVAITMVTYGSVKIIKLQFPGPSFGKLIEPVGNLSPMGLAWTYMGYSTGFNYFTGIAELSVGLLLFFRKTTTLGAIVGLVVAGNIMAINYCFDVPVKLLSTALVVMCLFLLLKDSRRLIALFLLNREAQPANLSPHRFKAKWKNIVLCVVKYVLVCYVVIGNIVSAIQASNQYGDKVKKPPLYGIYSVITFVKNNDILPPLTTDTARWSKMMVSFAGGAGVRLMNDSMKYYAFKPDTSRHTIAINTYADTVRKYIFTYSLKNDTLVLKGKLKQDLLEIRMRRYGMESFPLIRRGFHMINEYPYNK